MKKPSVNRKYLYFFLLIFVFSLAIVVLKKDSVKKIFRKSQKTEIKDTQKIEIKNQKDPIKKKNPLYFVEPAAPKNYYSNFDSIKAYAIKNYTITDTSNRIPKIQNFRLTTPLNHKPPHFFHKFHNPTGGGIILSTNGNDGIEKGCRISIGFWDSNLNQSCVNTYTDYPRSNYEVSQHSFRDVWVVTGLLGSEFPRRSMQVLQHDKNKTLFAQGIKLPNGPKKISMLEIPNTPQVANIFITAGSSTDIVVKTNPDIRINGGMAIWSNANNTKTKKNSVIGIGLFDSRYNQVASSVYQEFGKDERSKITSNVKYFISIADSLGDIVMLGRIKEVNPLTIEVIENRLSENAMVSLMLYDGDCELITIGAGNSVKHNISNPQTMLSLSSGFDYFGFGFAANDDLQAAVNFSILKNSKPAYRVRSLEEALLTVYDLSSNKRLPKIRSKLILEDLTSYQVNYKWIGEAIVTHGLVIGE